VHKSKVEVEQQEQISFALRTQGLLFSKMPNDARLAESMETLADGMGILKIASTELTTDVWIELLNGQ